MVRIAITKIKTKKDAPAWRIEYYVRINGVRCRKQETLPYVDRSTAETIRAMRISAAIRREDLKPKQVKNPRLGALVDQYLNATEYKRSHRRDLSSAPHIKEHLGRLRVKELIPDHAEVYRQKRRNEKTPRRTQPTIATMNREVSFVKAVLSWAYKNKHVDDLLLRGVPMEKGENERNRVLTDEEFERLLKHSPDHLRNVLVCAWETGMRRGEIFGLTWGQVDLKARRISLTADQTKTRKPRRVPITDSLLDVLQSIPQGFRTSASSCTGTSPSPSRCTSPS